VGINWMGESSTLSGADAIAWPGLGLNIPPKQRSMAKADEQIRDFFKVLNQKIGAAILEDDLASSRQAVATRLRQLGNHYTVGLPGAEQADHSDHQLLRQTLAAALGEAIVTPREQLSIPELTKRLFNLRAVAKDVPDRDRQHDTDPLLTELPESFKDVNLWNTDLPMGWFRGDGDRAGQHIREITQDPDQIVAAQNLSGFSHQMRQWGKWLKQSFDNTQGRIVFAGGDDFLGVFHPAETPTKAMQWLCRFKEEVWHRGEDGQADPKPVTPSVGFVWASSQVPQRDILQHCELAEQSAKQNGRDRICLRLLFSSGTHLEWACPWWLLPKIMQGYCDRDNKPKRPQNWTHIYNDVATLEARHGFRGNHQVALALFNLYFVDPDNNQPLLPDASAVFAADSPLWTQGKQSGILHDDLKEASSDKQQTAFNAWVIALAKVGFHLFNDASLMQTSRPSAA